MADGMRMLSMTMDKQCNHEAAQLLPWHLTGRLSAEQNAMVRAHLELCVACATEERHERRLQTLISGDDTVEHAPQPGLQQLLARIDHSELTTGAVESSAEHAGGFQRPAYLRWLVAAVVVQAVGLGVLGILLWERDGSSMQGQRFTTLSAPAPELAPGAHVRVVFAPTMSIKELQALLDSLRATVAAGPSSAGVYTLAVAGGNETAAAALRQLRASSQVLFAESLPDSRSTP